MEERREDELGARINQRSSADLRRMEDQELRLAQESDLPMVREKHRHAARCWAQIAADRERAEQWAGPRAAAGGFDATDVARNA